MVLAGNFRQKYGSVISDTPYKQYGLSEITGPYFRLKLPASTIYLSPIHSYQTYHYRLTIQLSSDYK